MRSKCRHCRKCVISRPRRLCWTCYADAGIRAHYPPAPARVGEGVNRWLSQPAAAPTPALPGTPEKVAVMAQRASLGQSLWHPEDAPLDMRQFAKVS